MEEPVNKWEDDPAGKDDWSERSGKLLRTLTSLLLYVSIYYLVFRDWKGILLLLLVLFIHEGGHYLAMRAFGYTDISLSFIPFFGAVISGTHHEVSPFRRALMILAGPIPGILIGMICILSGEADMHDLVFRSGVLFMLLNVFNLLPMKPLDGGQLLFALFPAYALAVQTVFTILAALSITVVAITGENRFLLILPFILGVLILIQWKKRGQVEPMLQPSPGQTLLLTLIWLTGLVSPLILLITSHFMGPYPAP